MSGPDGEHPLGGTDYRRDTEALRRAKFERRVKELAEERRGMTERLAGKLEDPEKLLSEEVRAFLEETLKTEQLEEYYRLMGIYEFVPISVAEAGPFIQWMELLAFRPTIRLFHFLSIKFGYKYEGTFPIWSATFEYTELKETLRYILMTESINNFSRGGADKSEETKERWRVIVTEKMEKSVDDLKEALSTDDFGALIKQFEETYDVPLSGIGISLLRRKPDLLKELKSVVVDVKALESDFGDLYKGNEMFLVLFSPHLEKFRKFVKGLKRPRVYEPLTGDSIVILNDITDENLDDFIAYWNWIEEYFVKTPLTLSNMMSLGGNWIEFRKMLGDDVNPWTDETRKRIDSFVKEFGFKVTLDKTVEGLADYYWKDEEIEALRKFTAVYSINTNYNVNSLRNDLKQLVDDGDLGRVTDPEAASLYVAASQHEYFLNDKTLRPIADLDILKKTDMGVEVLEKNVPGAEKILLALAKSGIPLFALTTIKKDEPNGQVVDYFIGILRNFTKHPGLLEQWEKVVRLYDWDEISLAVVYQWLQINGKRRASLNDSTYAKSVNSLKSIYGFQISLNSLLELTSAIETHEEQAEWFKILCSKKCQDFYKKNKGLFNVEERKTHYAEGEIRRILAVAKLYEAVQKDPSYLRWAKKWNSFGNDIGFFFITDHVDFSIFDEINFDDLDKHLTDLGLDFKSNSWYNYKNLNSHIPVISSEEFKTFAQICFEKLGWYRNIFVLETIVEFYLDPDKRAFLSDPEVHKFLDKAKKYGYKFDYNSYEEFVALYETKNIFEVAQSIGKNYKVDIQKQAKIAEGKESEFGLFNLSKRMTGIKTRGFDFLTEVKILIDSGDINVLLDKKTIEFMEFCKKEYRYEFFVLHISSIISIARNEHLQKLIRDPKLKTTMKKLSVGFYFELIDVFAAVIENEEVFDDLMEYFKEFLGYNFEENKIDLFVIIDILGREKVVERIKSEEFKKLFEKLKKERKYTFKVGDVYALIHLLDHPELVDVMFDPAIDELTQSVFGKRLNNLSDRIRFYEVFKDPKKREAVQSEEFKALRMRVKDQIKIDGSIDEIEGYLLLLEHPEVFDFLKAIDLSFGFSFNFRALNFFNSAPSLIKMAELGVEKYILALRKAAKGKWYYDFNTLDGAAWEILVQKYPNVDELVKKVEEFQEVIDETTLATSDFYFYLLWGKRFRADAEGLKGDIEKVFENDVHRSDSNFDSYSSYNDLSKFTLVQLNKMRAMMEWLDDAGARKEVGALVHEDVKKYPYTELGSVLVLNADGNFEHRPYPPKLHFNNGSYRPPPEAKLDFPISLATGHCHALKFKQGNDAGPSGGRFDAGGDISVAQIEGRDSFVVTSLSETEFVVHFYNPKGHVTFLGKYEY